MNLDWVRRSTIVYFKGVHRANLTFHLRDWNQASYEFEVERTFPAQTDGQWSWSNKRMVSRSEVRALCGVTIRATETWGTWPWEAPAGGWKDTDEATMLRLDHALKIGRCCSKCRAILGSREMIRL